MPGTSPVCPGGGRLPTRCLPWCRPKLWGFPNPSACTLMSLTRPEIICTISAESTTCGWACGASLRAYAQPPGKPAAAVRSEALVPCLAPPSGAVIRKFEIAAIQKDLVYNRFGDHDPEGLLFVPLNQAEDVRRGCRQPVPLILRANAGDWIQVTLHNLFDPKVPIRQNEYPSVPVEQSTPPATGCL